MRTKLTRAEVAAIEQMRARTMKLHAQVAAIETELEDLLDATDEDFAPDASGADLGDFIMGYLSNGDSTTEEFLARIGVQVAT